MSAALDAVEARLAPLEEGASLAYWAMATESTPEHRDAAAEAELALEEALSDPALLAVEAGPAADDRRRAELVRLAALPRQRPRDLAERIVRLETELAGRFSAFRGTIGERTVDDNEIDRILLHSTDEGERRAAWDASRAVAAAVADDLRELVALRNESARALGHRDHYALSLASEEIDEGWLYAFLDDLDVRLAPIWRAELAAIESDLRARLGLAADAPLAAWHRTDRFGQDPPPPVADPLLEAAEGVDILGACRAYFGDLGHDVDDVLARSDLYPRAGKDQHAFQATPVRGSDVRILCNIVPSLRWLDTTLHELGHAVYETSIDSSLPWLLRTNAHTLVTEAIAMLHGRRGRDAAFLTRYAGLPAAVAEHPANRATLRRELVVFAQWVQVMARFERALYADPGADLSAEWWRLVEHHQGIPCPPGDRRHDWAAKIHLTVAPVYYHNYLLGQVLASQLEALIAAETGDRSPAVRPAVAGPLIGERVLRHGARLRWDELVERATGRPLGVDAFVGEL